MVDDYRSRLENDLYISVCAYGNVRTIFAGLPPIQSAAQRMIGKESAWSQLSLVRTISEQLRMALDSGYHLPHWMLNKDEEEVREGA